MQIKIKIIQTANIIAISGYLNEPNGMCNQSVFEVVDGKNIIIRHLIH